MTDRATIRTLIGLDDTVIPDDALDVAIAFATEW